MCGDPGWWAVSGVWVEVGAKRAVPGGDDDTRGAK